MLEPTTSGGERHIIMMIEREPGLTVFHALSLQHVPVSQRPNFSDWPVWDATVERIVAAAFAGRAVCFVAYQPPIGWSDLELEHLTYPIKTLRSGEHSYKLGFAAHAGRAALAEAAGSQDFRHGGLLIAALSEHPGERAARFLAQLSHMGTLFPPHKAWLRLPSEEQMALFRAQDEAKLRIDGEWIECVGDGEELCWYHGQPAALTRCRGELEAWATQQGWRFASISN